MNYYNNDDVLIILFFRSEFHILIKEDIKLYYINIYRARIAVDDNNNIVLL